MIVKIGSNSFLRLRGGFLIKLDTVAVFLGTEKFYLSFKLIFYFPFFLNLFRIILKTFLTNAK